MVVVILSIEVPFIRLTLFIKCHSFRTRSSFYLFNMFHCLVSRHLIDESFAFYLLFILWFNGWSSVKLIKELYILNSNRWIILSLFCSSMQFLIITKPTSREGCHRSMRVGVKGRIILFILIILRSI
jgi:hypothetical protein